MGFQELLHQAEALRSFLKERDEKLDTALLINVPKEFILKE